MCAFASRAKITQLIFALNGVQLLTRSSADADNRLDAFTITVAPVNTTVTYNEAIFVTSAQLTVTLTLKLTVTLTPF